MKQIQCIIALFLLSLASSANAAEDIATRKANDGTYQITIVDSVEACKALCQNDETHICRGHVFYQNDIRKSSGECRLNSGIGENSFFKIEPPAEIDQFIVLRDLNNYRAQYGLPPLTWNSQLARAADVHVKDLAFHGLIQHEGTDGSHHGDRVLQQGYTYSTALENVAAGQRNWADALQGWKDSKGHNEALLSDEATEFGVAVEFNPTTQLATYWAMVLASPYGTN